MEYTYRLETAKNRQKSTPVVKVGLTQVEQAFRTCKTTHLETRPIHVRTEAHTRAHVLVVMLAYLIRRVLSRAWAALDVTVEEGLQQLKALSSTEMKIKEGGSCLRIPMPNPACRDLLQALDIRLPDAMPSVKVPVVENREQDMDAFV